MPMAAQPGGLLKQVPPNMNMDDPDADGEYDDDEADYAPASPQTTREVPMAGDEDAEGEEISEDEEDFAEPVGAVKVAAPADTSESEHSDADVQDDDESASEAKLSDVEDSDSESDEAENEWQAESEEDQDPGAGRVNNACTFCNQGEEDDPSEDYEEYLSCQGCGDHAHRQCARDANTLSSDDDAPQWRCPACLQEQNRRGSSTSLTSRQLSTAPKVARELLPAQRGADPDAHSVFNDLILADDPLDGSRSLRHKRKVSADEETPALRQTRRRRRSSAASKPDEVNTRRSRTRATTMTDNEVDQVDGAAPAASERGSSRLRSTATRARQTSTRPRRAGERPLVWIEEEGGAHALGLTVVFHLNNKKVQDILARKPRRTSPTRDEIKKQIRRDKERERRARIRAEKLRAQSPEASHYPALQPNFSAPFYAIVDKEDDTKNKPYGGILTEAEADTSKTYPMADDRKYFEIARLKAEEEWKQKQAALSAGQEPTKPQKHAVAASKIRCINFGGHEIDTWHAAPYPEEYSKNKVLYLCEFCLKYMPSDYVAWRHKLKCEAKHPPGDEIYRDGKYSFFEVDGRKNPVYCQNLCLLAKLFLGSKTLYYDVEPFLFYVMAETDDHGCHFVGYFSKEKRPSSQNNVSCILVLPIHMRKGYGQYLIEFSYLLTRVERKTGSPEKPLSDMGLVSYRKYWRLVLCQELLNEKGPISISAISERTGMTPDDIVSALEGLRALVRDPITKKYALRLDYAYFKEYIAKNSANDNPKIKPEKLQWVPYVMGRLGQYEDGPGIQTVQQREEVDEDAKAEPEEGIQQVQVEASKNGTSATAAATTTAPTADGATEDPTTAPAVNGDTPIPETPLPEGFTDEAADAPIPPDRYQIFPAPPGTQATKRRPGRPFGTRRRPDTPKRTRSTPIGIATAPVARTRMLPSKNGNGLASPSVNGTLTPSGMSLRRTRSKLGQVLRNGNGNGDENGDEAVEGGAVRGIMARRRTRSSTGSFADLKGKDKASNGLTNGNGHANGNGTANGHDDEDAHGETDADADVDAEGDEDPDAEGESDDEVDVVMADA